MQSQVPARVLFIDDAHEILRERLEEMGFDCHFALSHTREEIAGIIAGYSGVVIRSRIQFDMEMIDLAGSLKFIARIGAGMESIDTEYARSKGIVCLNSPEGNRDALAEHATGMLLMLLCKLSQADREVRGGLWNRENNRGTELMGKTVSIIGFGNMGSAFAQRLSGFGCKILAYDKYKSGYAPAGVRECSMEEIFAETDILSLHVPLTDETKYLVNDAYIAEFAKPLMLINTARGPVVETAALVMAMKAGKVYAAALDVIEYEESSFECLKSPSGNPDYDYLISSPDTLLSPHIAGWSHESKRKLAEVLADKIEALKI